MRKKSKTFTGCWTCRARRVKCDEVQPVCNRCTKARRICEGYGVRLTWTSDEKDTPFRVLIDLDMDAIEISPDDLDDMIHKCGYTEPSHETQTFGPFSVFSIGQSTDLEPSEPRHLDTKEGREDQWLQGETATENLYTPSSNESLIGTCQPSLPESSNETLLDVTIFDNFAHEATNSNHGYVDENDNLVLDELRSAEWFFGPSSFDLESQVSSWAEFDMLPFEMESDSTSAIETSLEGCAPSDHAQFNNIPFSFWHEAPPPQNSLNPISMSQQQTELIHHWLVHMCRNMVPIDTLDNPYRGTYLRLASEGVNGASKSHIAVLHGVCAAAAHNLDTLRHDKTNTQSAWNAQVALKNLQESISLPKGMDHASVLAAIAMCIMQDTMTGHPRGWRTHIQAALRIIVQAKLYQGLDPGSELHVVVLQCLCLVVLGDVDTQHDLADMVSQLPRTEDYVSKHHSVTKDLVGIISQINTLSKQDATRDLAMVDQLELQIYLQVNPITQHDRFRSEKVNFINQHYASVWHYATIIHFQRRIRHKPAEQLRDIVSEALAHLEAAEDVSTDLDGCIALWPCMVIATECYDEEHKMRALSWFKKKDRHAFANVSLASTICLEYWKWRDRNPSWALTTSWQDFVASTEYDVVPFLLRGHRLQLESIPIMAAEHFDTSWMWNPAFIEKATSTAGRFVHFRKTFFVNAEIPISLPIQITADTRYKLYVNKQLVAFGPVKGDANLWFYDEVDISPYLRLGENHIAIHVLRLFHGTSYGTSFPRLGTGGVKIATVVDDEVWTPQIRSSELWQTAIDQNVTVRIDEEEDDFLHVYELVSASRDTWLEWIPAILLRFQNSTGVTAPWKLSPRLIPPMRGQKSYFSAIHNVQSGLPHGIWSAGLLGIQSRESNLLLPARSSHQFDLETPVHTTAFIRFRFVRPDVGGACLTITYSESYEDTPVLVPYLRCKGNRCDTSKFLIGPKDIYTFRGKDGNPRLAYYDDEDTEEVYMPFHWRTFRFMRLNIETGSSDLIMRGIDIDVVNYPLDVLSNITTTSDDGTLGALYSTSIRTLQNCMHDCYEDCPFYEQLQYAMDTRSSCLFTYHVSGDDRLARQAIIQLHSSFQPRIGLTASRAPSTQLQIIPHFSLYWICMLHDHFLYYADKAFVRPLLPVVDAVLGYFHERIDDRLDLVSLRDEKGVWNFHDWAEQWRPYGIPPSVEKSGISTYTNSLYAYTLKLAAELQGECAGRLSLAEEYYHRAGLIVDAVKRQCFDGQYFTDSIAACSDPQIDRSQHNQVWAVLSGAVCGDSAQALLKRALGSSQSGAPLIKTSISMSFYTFRAISIAGGSLYDELFHVLWQPWRHQLSLGLTTWEEDDVSHRSDCHAWGSAPIYEFLAEVAGIRPAKAGWQEIEFAPRLGLYTSLEATVPFYREDKMVLAKVGWSSLDGETRVTLGIEGLDEPISVHVKLPGWPAMVEKSSQSMVFTWTRS
ncbi:hypothetical protein LB504_005013 [Fusarium proliferatum]|nr:hypothetical protein LB504_005013 [Fusarium proliferatum]